MTVRPGGPDDGPAHLTSPAVIWFEPPLTLGGRAPPLSGCPQAPGKGTLLWQLVNPSGRFAPHPANACPGGSGSVRSRHSLASPDERGTVMPFSRRDAFKLGGLGALGVAGLAIPFGNMVSAKDPSQLPQADVPVPYETASAAGHLFQRRAARVGTRQSGVDGEGPIDRYDQSERRNDSTSSLDPSAVWRDSGDGIRRDPGQSSVTRVPGYRIDVEAGHPTFELTMHNNLPAVHSHLRTPMRTVNPPARVGVLAAVRRLCQRYHRTRTGEDATSIRTIQPARTLWYHDHGIHYTGAECAIPGWPPSTTCTTMEERGCFRPTTRPCPAAGTCQPEYDVGLIISGHDVPGQWSLSCTTIAITPVSGVT